MAPKIKPDFKGPNLRWLAGVGAAWEGAAETPPSLSKAGLCRTQTSDLLRALVERCDLSDNDRRGEREDGEEEEGGKER